jgi:hypothetical protein
MSGWDSFEKFRPYNKFSTLFAQKICCLRLLSSSSGLEIGNEFAYSIQNFSICKKYIIGTVFFAVQVHTVPVQAARIKNTSTVKAARNASIAVHLQSVLAAAARTASTKDNSVQSDIKK